MRAGAHAKIRTHYRMPIIRDAEKRERQNRQFHPSTIEHGLSSSHKLQLDQFSPRAFILGFNLVLHPRWLSTLVQLKVENKLDPSLGQDFHQ